MNEGYDNKIEKHNVQNTLYCGHHNEIVQCHGHYNKIAPVTIDTDWMALMMEMRLIGLPG